jgi:hypothetical protein
MSSLKSKEYYLNNAQDDDVSVLELSNAIIAGIITFNELMTIVPEAKFKAIQYNLTNNQNTQTPPINTMPLNTRDYYIDNVDSTEAKELADAIMAEIVSFDELQDTMMFSITEQRKVRDIMEIKATMNNAIESGSIKVLERLLDRPNLPVDDRRKIETKIFELRQQAEIRELNEAKSVKELEEFINKYPDSKHLNEASAKIEQLKIKEEKERKKYIDDIVNNIHNANPKLIFEKYGEDVLKAVCDRINLNYDDVKNIRPVVLDNTGDKPEDVIDIAEGYTDVFFWGLPSSGKSCAMASIFNTIRKEYVMMDPEKGKIFGAPYRTSLSSIFNDEGIGYLPKGNAALLNDTHYMNFVLKNRNSNKSINLSFLEISGEIFKYFKKLAHNSNAEIPHEIEPTLELLNSILISKNPKIHFFFIDYQQESDQKGKIGSLATQEDYLDAAATYFNNNKDIFKHQTLSIHIVITKADLMKGDDKKAEAEEFVYSRFGSFIERIKYLKKKNNISNPTVVFPFSIGNVYFNSMCKLNKEHPKIIVDKLLSEVKPQNPIYVILKKIFNN